MRSPGDYISQRAHGVDASGIRKVFDLAATMKDPINLSIGQPDFAVPNEVQQAASARNDPDLESSALWFLSYIEWRAGNWDEAARCAAE